jgi:ElaB/YqjD/DUF883 family membrane-anchored ribosome-binding protein
VEYPTATPGVSPVEVDKSPDLIEREMEQTRESLTQKVAALENQVLGTIQTATNTISDTVQSVKDTVNTAPAAVRDTVQETVAAVKDSVAETISQVRNSVTSFSVSDCVRENPLAAVGTSLVGGFLAGLCLTTGRRPIMARGTMAPAADGHTGVEPKGVFGQAPAYEGPSSPGILSNLAGMVGGELQQLVRQALTTAVESLKQSVNQRVPGLMDDAVQTVTDRLTGQDGAGATHAARSHPPYTGPRAATG